MSLLDALLLDPYRINSWISYRADGVNGSGTQNDPYDGSANLAAPVTISGFTNSALEATATSSLAHGYSVNDVVTIDVQTNPASWSGTFLISSVPSSTTFKYLMNNLPGGTPSGTMTASKVLGYRFDGIMSTLGSNVRVHLGPTSANRPFLTKGYPGTGGWQAKAGMKIIGSGIDVTTVRLVGDPAGGTYYAIAHDLSAGPVDYFEVSDMTIDCNMMIPTAAGNAVCGAVLVMGNYARVRRIKVINWGANSAKPLFAVCMVMADDASTASPVSNCGIEDVIAILPASSPMGATITALHAGPAADSGQSLKE